MQALLSELRNHRIHLSVNDGELIVKFPKGKIEPELLGRIKSNKELLIQYLKGNPVLTYDEIPRAPKQSGYVLSSAQRRLWILSQFEGGNAAYNIPVCYVFTGRLDTKALSSSFNRLIHRHEILRTVFNENERGDVKQFIRSPQESEFQIEFRDLRNKPNQDELVRKSVQEEGGKEFDLKKGPLMRATLFQIEERRWVFLFVIHHIISDGWSMEILISELLKFYHFSISGTNDDIEPLRVHYKDYAAWQQGQLNSEWIANHKAYWLKQFQGELPVLEMPTENRRPLIKTYNGRLHVKTIDSDLTEKLKTFTKQAGATLFMGLLALVKALLYKHTSQVDITVGSPIAGREHADLDGQIGFYVNTLALRTRFDENDTFAQLLERVKVVTMEAYDHQAFPFDELVESLNPRWDRSRQVLFNIMVVLQNADLGATFSPRFDDLTVEPYREIQRLVSLFDYRFEFQEAGNQILATVEYNSDIVTKSAAELLADHLVELLRSLLDNGKTSLKDIQYMLPAERDLILRRFNDTAHVFRSHDTLVDLFDEQVTLKPNSIAVVDSTSKTTFASLSKESNRLANFLINKLQVSREMRVGLLLSPSVNLSIAILAVMKAGCAYVPLDSEFPESRIKYMLDDAAIDVLITERSFMYLANRLQWQVVGVRHLICIDSNDVYSEKGEGENQLMRREVWEYVGNTAADIIEGGGWKSSYTGSALTEDEMAEYRHNTLFKLKPVLRPGMKVLEIGCSSGLTILEIAPHVGKYVGIDFSESILQGTRERLFQNGIRNVTLICASADKVDEIAEQDFDLVIFNSVVHCFEGHNYFRDSLKKSIDKLKNTGLVFLGDLLDEDKREFLVSSLAEFKRNNSNGSFRTKTDWSQELFISKSYLTDLIGEAGIVDVTCSDKIHSIENELTRFRFDALLTINKSKLTLDRQYKSKRQFDYRAIATQPPDPIASLAMPESLACIIYTSGSTGNPKGCMLEHRGLVNRLEWMWHAYQFGPDDVILQKTNYTFDVSIWELLMPLCWGAKEVYCPKQEVARPDRLMELIRLERITCVHFVPSMLKAFLTFFNDSPAEFEKLQSLKRLICSGEQLADDVADRWFMATKVPIFNLYGPTEASIDVTHCRVHPGDKVSIGTPIWNTGIYILGDGDRIEPVNAPGEICISGGIARGYLNLPELTATRFVNNPFVDNAKMYKTGDLGRWMANGTIEYLGRIDDQVKIRGFRIELKEVESSIREYPGVHDVVVTGTVVADGDRDLVAYYVTDARIVSSELSEFLRERLPQYMIPSHFIPMERLPLTTSGKVDKKRLPNPATSTADYSTRYAEASDDLERQLVSIWRKVLGKEKVGVTDNFFELGGNSIKIIRLAKELSNTLAKEITVPMLFQYPTIRDLMIFVSGVGRDTDDEVHPNEVMAVLKKFNDD